MLHSTIPSLISADHRIDQRFRVKCKTLSRVIFRTLTEGSAVGKDFWGMSDVGDEVTAGT